MDDDRLDDALRSLRSHDVDAWRRERVRLSARRALESPEETALSRAYRRWVEPSLLFAFCSAHLAWTFAATAAVLL
jgi:hypothetical protein